MYLLLIASSEGTRWQNAVSFLACMFRMLTLLCNAPQNQAYIMEESSKINLSSKFYVVIILFAIA